MTARTRVAALFFGAMVLAACAPDSSDATPIAAALANTSVTLTPTEVESGLVVFETENLSVDLVHEIEVFSGATEGAVLPVGNSVADTEGLTLLDEVEDLVPGASASLTIDLEPGTYLVICNLPDHYTHGMSAYLTVTGS